MALLRAAGGLALRWLLSGLLWLPSIVLADRPQWTYQTFPFGQALNVQAAYEVAHSPPEEVVATIRRWGVEVQRVPMPRADQPVNPVLAALPAAAPELLRQSEFRESYQGLVVHRDASCCALGCDTILIRETAPTYTLIHEFVQSLLRPLCVDDPDDTVEARFASAFRRLVTYQRRLFDDPYKLLNPLWRRDILSAQADVARDLHARIRLGQSQEAIVEKLLSQYIDERNPFYDASRRAEGLLYGELMINNAIDIFNEVNDSVVFVESAVRNLWQGLREGSIEPGEGVALNGDDVAAVVEAARNTEARLAVVRADLQALKQFYAR